MILKQLKQLTLSATRINARVLWLPRLYSSPAVCQPVTNSKPSKRLSRDARRALVETFVTEYRAANAGKFPTLNATVKEVGGGYYIVRDILQELKLRPNATFSQVPASVANDASLLKQEYTIESSHTNSDEVSLQGDNNLVIDKSKNETTPLDKYVDSKSDGSPHLPESQTLMVAADYTKNLEIEEEGTLKHLGSQGPKEDHLEGANVLPAEISYQYNVITATHDKGETKTAQPSNEYDCKCDDSHHRPESQMSKVAEECLKNSEIEEEGILTHKASEEPRADFLEGANILTTATHGKRETETAPPENDVDSKCDSSTHLPDNQTLKVAEECVNNSETKDEGTLTHLGSQEPKADHIEGVAVSANALPSETRQTPAKGDGEVKTGENSSAWSNIISFAKGFANFWRKG